MSQFIKNLISRSSSLNTAIKPRLLSRYESSGTHINDFQRESKTNPNQISTKFQPIENLNSDVKREPDFKAEQHSDGVYKNDLIKNGFPNMNSNQHNHGFNKKGDTNSDTNEAMLHIHKHFSDSTIQTDTSTGLLGENDNSIEERSEVDQIMSYSNDRPLLTNPVFWPDLPSNASVDAQSPQALQDPVIKVSIGQIEVKAIVENQKERPKRKSTNKPKMSLQDYLDKLKDN